MEGSYVINKLKLKRQKMNIIKEEREMNWTPWKQKQSFPLPVSHQENNGVLLHKRRHAIHTGNSCLRDSNSLIDRRLLFLSFRIFLRKKELKKLHKKISARFSLNAKFKILNKVKKFKIIF